MSAMNEVQLTNGSVANGDTRTAEAQKENKIKRAKHKKKRRNSDLAAEENRDQSTKRYSDVYDVQLRHRQIGKPASSTKVDPASDFFSPAIDHKLQMIIIGDRDVGKTCFLERYADDKFKDESKSTIGIDFRMKTLTVAGRKVRLQIWDTAGQERFNSITTAYYRNAKGILLIYDVTKPESYDNLPKWLGLIEEYARSDVEIAIVGNKADLPEVKVNSSKARHFIFTFGKNRLVIEIPMYAELQFAEDKGYLFYETSAKERLNIETVFVNLIYKILKQIPEPHERNPRIRRKTNIVDINQSSPGSVKNSSCCKIL